MAISINRKTPVRITGLGAISALGEGVESLWSGLCAARIGLAPSRRLRMPERPELAVGEAPALGGELDAEAAGRVVPLARCAAREALEQSGWGAPLDGEAAERTALIVASTKGSIGLAQRVLEQRSPAEALHDFPLFALARQLARELRVRGPVQTISVACASGTVALGHALRLLRAGRAERALVVGADALSEFVVRGFAALRAVASVRARPFDAERDGLSVGEGAAAVALERGSGPALARLAGYGASNDANHMTGPARDGAGLSRALHAALSDAGCAAGAIDAVSAHGTGTRYNDAMEGRAYVELLVDRRPPVNGIKGAIGHTMGAAGVLEAVLCTRALRAGAWPPTPGLTQPDPSIALDLVRDAPREGDYRTVVSSSSGFSGINAAVVLCRHP